MLASRYPILDARYECYPNGRGEDALAAKGALFAKVSGLTFSTRCSALISLWVVEIQAESLPLDSDPLVKA